MLNTILETNTVTIVLKQNTIRCFPALLKPTAREPKTQMKLIHGPSSYFSPFFNGCLATNQTQWNISLIRIFNTLVYILHKNNQLEKYTYKDIEIHTNVHFPRGEN